MFKPDLVNESPDRKRIDLKIVYSLKLAYDEKCKIYKGI